MRTIYPFCVPCEHPFVGQCPPDVQEHIPEGSEAI